jgi:hypothetical protein
MSGVDCRNRGVARRTDTQQPAVMPSLSSKLTAKYFAVHKSGLLRRAPLFTWASVVFVYLGNNSACFRFLKIANPDTCKGFVNFELSLALHNTSSAYHGAD